MRFICESCQHTASSFFLCKGEFVCKFCYEKPAKMDECRLFEYGHENPSDPKGSTAHVRDIKSRMKDRESGKVVNYQAPKSYFIGGHK